MSRGNHLLVRKNPAPYRQLGMPLTYKAPPDVSSSCTALALAGPQRHPITAPEQGTFGPGAACPIVDHQPVADPQPVLSAQPQNRDLEIAGEGRREGRVEPSGVDP